MAAMAKRAKPRAAGAGGARRVTVRPVRGEAERARWDTLMRDHHYLGFRGMIGNSLRHVAERSDGVWVALLGWRAGAHKLAARDKWIGWTSEQRSRRLHLIANNVRFVILPGCSEPNLASRVLGRSLRRLSEDMRGAHGHPVLLAETFVDPALFAGTSYRAANWEAVGLSKGYERVSGGGYREHGRPKTILVRELSRDARALLRGRADDPAWGCASPAPPPEALEPVRLRSLYDHLRGVPDFRACRGLRHQLATVLAIALAAQLCGASGVAPTAEFAKRLNQRQLGAVRAWTPAGGRRRTAPGQTTFFRVLSSVDGDALDRALRDWAASHCDPEGALALDGKRVRGASRQMDGNENCHLIAALEHGSGLVCGQVQVADKTNEIPAVRDLLAEMDLAGRIVTADAMHTQTETARLIVGGGADYLLTAKDNQTEMLDDIRAIDWARAAAGECETVDRAHGRIDTRRCRVVELDETFDGYALLPGRRQAFRIERERHLTDKTTTETAHGLTSLPPERAGAAEILDLARRHWEIENRLHHVRDVSYDEDRRRNHVKSLPRNLACLRNAAISIVRLRGQFDYLPQAHRHYAARQQDAIREVTRAVF